VDDDIALLPGNRAAAVNAMSRAPQHPLSHRLLTATARLLVICWQQRPTAFDGGIEDPAADVRVNRLRPGVPTGLIAECIESTTLCRKLNLLSRTFE